MNSHQLIDERSLAFDRLIAKKLKADPALVERAKANIERWLEATSPRSRPALLEWKKILEKPIDDICDQLLAFDENAKRLRQSSPFAGMLTQAERTAILRDYQDRESDAA
ncbi:MAG: hypothetical protein AAGA58_02945 [Verrucomicrobiota bacterium]